VNLVSEAFGEPFFVNALIAGSFVAIAAGLVGYFLVQRMEVFTGDALSHVAFTAALVALVIGVDLRVGLFVGTIGVAVLMGSFGQRARSDDVTIGSVLAWTLGLGVLFLTLFTTSGSGNDGSAGISVLFGSIFGLDNAQTWTAVGIAVVISVLMLLIARPLLFATIDPAIAAARGVPTRLLGYVFLMMVGAVSAEATQVVGSLLLLGLLAAPAGAARCLTGRPFPALWLSALLALADIWVGLWLAETFASLPPSFTIIATAAFTYLAAGAYRALRLRQRARANVTAPSRESTVERSGEHQGAIL
jgi:zinc/manganese transport system permease protein